MFYTQIESARKGIVTEAMEAVATAENKEPEWIREQVAKGRIAIPCNRNHKKLTPCGVGEGLRTKINVNLGISKDCGDYSSEMRR